MFTIVAPAVATAQSKEEAERIIEKSRIVVEEMMASRDRVVPEDLLRDCAGLAIIPGNDQRRFHYRGSYGKGVVLAHKDGKWTGPAFIYLGCRKSGFPDRRGDGGPDPRLSVSRPWDSFL